MERWNGKVALVTGASTGIGAAIAVSLVKHGLIVVAVARRLEKLQELEKLVEGARGTLHTLQCDVSKQEEIVKTFQWIKTNLKTIHVLINNAGYARFGRLVEDDPQTFRDIIEVNVMALTICSQQAFKLMKETGVDDGHIINISSIAGHHVGELADPIANIYPATKFAVRALTETLRQEVKYLKTKIKVSSISPGIVKTEFFDVSSKDTGKGENFADILKNSDVLQPQDLADSVVFVLSTPPHMLVQDLIIRPID